MAIENWTDEEYYKDNEYFSVSTFKRFEKCEYSGTKGVYNNTPSTAMLVGSYVDAYIEGTLDKFKEDHPEIFSTRGANKGELKAEFKRAEEICKYIDNNETLKQFFSGEKQTVMTGKICDVPFKIKMDSYHPDVCIVDGKCMASITNKQGKYIDFISTYGYDVQMACYQEIVYQNTGKKLPCYIASVSKDEPINSVIIHIPQPYLDRALYRVENSINRLYDVKMGRVEALKCGVCDACIRDKTTTEIISFESLLGG